MPHVYLSKEPEISKYQASYFLQVGLSDGSIVNLHYYILNIWVDFNHDFHIDRSVVVGW